jgi:MFS family permease
MALTSGMKRNTAVLVTAQVLGGASPPVISSLGGMVGLAIAPHPALATVPISCYIVGLALGALPATIAIRRLGRREAYLAGATVGILAGLIAACGILVQNFWLFCFGTLVAGFYGNLVQTYRYAIVEVVGSEVPYAKAISWVMIAGLAAAIVGPQLVILTQHLGQGGVPFLWSFVSQSALALLAMMVLTQLRFDTSGAKAKAGDAPPRPLREIIRQPDFILATSGNIVSYSLMKLLMTSAPMSMVICGFSVDQAAMGIQWHILSMFAPSFFTPRLIKRFGSKVIMLIGLTVCGIAASVALFGIELWQFYTSLVLVGIGWNFGFIGGTALLVSSFTSSERVAAQGTSDGIMFTFVAIASFSSGAILNVGGWHMVNWITVCVASTAILIGIALYIFSPARRARRLRDAPEAELAVTAVGND